VEFKNLIEPMPSNEPNPPKEIKITAEMRKEKEEMIRKKLDMFNQQISAIDKLKDELYSEVNKRSEP